jgi:phospholipase/carboxylesterase
MSELLWVPPLDGRPGYLFREFSSAHEPYIVMLHGRSGDERSMWILERFLLGKSLKVAPRGIFAWREGGYHWSQAVYRRSARSDFNASVTALSLMTKELEARFPLDGERLILMGFSQGAAVAFSMAASINPRPAAVISLAGFLPEGDFGNLAGIPIFWGHGIRDKMLPIEGARLGVQRLRDIGAHVHYCETDVGHKLGAACARGLDLWVRSIFPQSGPE